MRSIIVAVIISLATCVFLYVLATAAGLPADLAKGLAGLTAFATKDVHEFIETRQAKLSLIESDSKLVPALQDFLISASNLLIMASIMFFGMLIATTAFEAAIMIILLMKLPQFTPTDEVAAYWSLFCNARVLQILAAIYIGRWIGMRSARFGFAIAIGSTFLGYLLGSVLSVVVAETTRGTAIVPLPGVSEEVTLMVGGISALIAMVAGAIGVKVGRREQLTRYMGFILGLLPTEVRRTIVEMARDEAVRISQPPVRTAPHKS